MPRASVKTGFAHRSMPPATTRAHGLRPNQYASSFGWATFQATKSARFPAASVPRSPRPSARAAWTVIPRSASSGVSRNSVLAMLSISSGDSVGDEPGLWSVAMAIGTPAARRAATGGSLRLAQEVERAGQENGDGAGRRHRRDAVGADVFEVVARQRAVFGGERRAVLVAQLLGVQLDRQAEPSRRVEDAPRLRGGEADAVAEAVDGVDQPLAVQCRQPRAHRVDVLVGAARELGRQRVRRQAGRLHGERQLAAEAARDAQAARLVLGGEAVARLDLDRRHAFAHQGEGALAGELEQGLVARRARRRDGRADAAAGLGDVLVARAFQALLELAGALAGVDEVGVAVDEARRDERAAEVDFGVGARVRRQVGFGTGPGDRVALDQQRAALDEAPAARIGEGGEARAAPERRRHRGAALMTATAPRVVMAQPPSRRR